MPSLFSLLVVSMLILAWFTWQHYTEHKVLKRRYDAFLRFCYEYKNKKPSPFRKGFDEPNELDALEADFMRWLLKNNYIGSTKHGLYDFGFTEDEVKKLNIEIWNKIYQYEKGNPQKRRNKNQNSV